MQEEVRYLIDLKEMGSDLDIRHRAYIHKLLDPSSGTKGGVMVVVCNLI